MFIRKIILHVDSNSDFKHVNKIKMSQALCKKWAIDQCKTISLQFGNLKEEVCIVETTKNKVPTIEISPTLAEKISIPFEILPIHCLYKQEENTLKLGPIISCITNQTYHEGSKFGNITPFFEELARFARHHHIFFYVKTLKQWDEKFYGYTFLEDNWIEDFFPVPNAIYNRIGSRHLEASKSFQQFSLYLQKEGINYFNHCFLDKWEIHETLIGFPEMIPYLPQTTLLDDYESFVEMLSVHGVMFVKPVFGSQGRQILRIEQSENRYIVTYSSFSDEVSTSFLTSYQLYKRLRMRLNQQPFIIQQGLDLIDFEGRSLDFRILCVKNSEQKWKVVSSVARISAQKKIVTNLAKGGEQKRPLDVLTQLFDEKLAKQYVKLMGELAIEAASLICESYDGGFGELGIDIALDKDGKLWIIEINSKPSKIETEEITKRIRPSTRAIIAYLAYLSGYPLKNER